MSEHPHVQLVRDGYAAFAASDLDGIRALFHPEITWHIGGRSPVTGDYKGLDAVFGFFGKVLEWTGGTLRNELHDVVANDDHAVALLTQTAEHNGKKLSARFAHIQHITKGKVTESWYFPDDSYAVDDFWT